MLGAWACCGALPGIAVDCGIAMPGLGCAVDCPVIGLAFILAGLTWDWAPGAGAAVGRVCLI